jgi:hypothetical protein
MQLLIQLCLAIYHQVRRNPEDGEQEERGPHSFTVCAAILVRYLLLRA